MLCWPSVSLGNVVKRKVRKLGWLVIICSSFEAIPQNLGLCKKIYSLCLWWTPVFRYSLWSALSGYKWLQFPKCLFYCWMNFLRIETVPSLFPDLYPKAKYTVNKLPVNANWMRIDTHGRRHSIFETTLLLMTGTKLNDSTRPHICYTGISSMIKHYILKRSSLKFRIAPRGGETFHPARKLPKIQDSKVSESLWN